MVFERNFLGSPCLLACLISRKTTQAFKNHCYLTLTWVAMTEKWCVLLSCPSFITHVHFWKNKNRELRLFFFYGPSSDQTPFRTCSSCTHFEKGCQGNPKQRRLHVLKAGKCISTSNLYTLLQIDSLLPFSKWSFKEQPKELHMFFKSRIQSIGSFFLLSFGYFSSVFTIISQFMYSKVNITK